MQPESSAFDRVIASSHVVSLLVIVVGVSAFYLGRLTVPATSPDTNETFVRSSGTPEVIDVASQPAEVVATQANYVASINGTRWYPVECSAASRISEANKIFFTTVDEAEAGGYTRAQNCP